MGGRWIGATRVHGGEGRESWYDGERRGGGGRPVGVGDGVRGSQRSRRGSALATGLAMDSPRDSSAGVGWEAGGVRGARERSTRRTASEHEADKRGWEGRMQGMAGMAEEWRQQQLQAMRCTEGRGGGGGGAPRHGCACEELGGRCHRARDRPRRSGCRAGGPSRNRSRWALCRWKKFHRRGGARGDDKVGVRVGQGGGDGGRRERAAWPRPGGLPPSSLAPSHNYPFPPPHQHNPHHPCCESFTRSVHSASTVVLLL